jgi:hypothetical protein
MRLSRLPISLIMKFRGKLFKVPAWRTGAQDEGPLMTILVSNSASTRDAGSLKWDLRCYSISIGKSYSEPLRIGRYGPCRSGLYFGELWHRSDSKSRRRYLSLIEHTTERFRQEMSLRLTCFEQAKSCILEA